MFFVTFAGDRELRYNYYINIGYHKRNEKNIIKSRRVAIKS